MGTDHRSPLVKKLRGYRPERFDQRKSEDAMTHVGNARPHPESEAEREPTAAERHFGATPWAGDED